MFLIVKDSKIKKLLILKRKISNDINNNLNTINNNIIK